MNFLPTKSDSSVVKRFFSSANQYHTPKNSEHEKHRSFSGRKQTGCSSIQKSTELVRMPEQSNPSGRIPIFPPHFSTLTDQEFFSPCHTLISDFSEKNVTQTDIKKGIASALGTTFRPPFLWRNHGKVS
jgi:hypothetical protein